MSPVYPAKVETSPPATAGKPEQRQIIEVPGRAIVG